ncbi:MAG: cell division protein FtsQ/DivIB, partial [Planctomycetota bacterium]
MPASVHVEQPPWNTAGFTVRASRALSDLFPVIRSGILLAVAVLRIPHVAKGLVALILIIVFWTGIQAAERELGKMEMFRVDPRCMKIREMPPWLDENWADSIRNPFPDPQKVNLFEPRLTAMIYDAYRESPWIEDICTVRKEFPNRLKIRIRLRTPLAAVPFGREYLLVDGHGVLLPRAFDQVPHFGFPLRVVEGVCEAPPEPGRCWNSKALHAGLQVAAILSGSKKKAFDRITRIDVSLVREDGNAGRTE